MDDIKERLEVTSQECMKCYLAWKGNENEAQPREALNEAIHELRKVASRLEIELAMSERNQMVKKPIPIPVHPDNNRGRGGDDQQGGKPRGGRRKSSGGGGRKPRSNASSGEE